MKIKHLLAVALLSVSANAATITITAGFGAQGLSVGHLATGEDFGTFYLAVGNYSEGVFTQFATTIEDTDKVNGVFTAQGPASLNNLPVHLWIGNALSVDEATSFVILSSSAGTAFPPDVSTAGGPTFNAAIGNNLRLVFATEDASFTAGENAIRLSPIPEPSTMLLGALGIVGLVRRRR